MTSFFDREFEAEIVRHVIGNGPRKVTYTVVWLPQDIEAKLPFDDFPRLRVTGEIADVPFEGAWQPAGEHGKYLMVPKQVFASAEVSVGDRVEIRFKITDQNAVDVPEALQDAIDSDDDLTKAWAELSAGKQRAFAYRVSSAKTEKTITKRVDEVTHMIRNGLSYGKGGKIV